MRSVIFVVVLLASPYLSGQLRQHEPPRVAWATPNPNYPLQVRILSSDRVQQHHAGITDTNSYGSGNLLGNPNVGLDYTSNCEGGFMHNAERGDYYQGRWKKQDRKIEILIVETGEKRPAKCEIDVTLKPAPYTRDNPPPRLVTARQ